MQNGDPGDPQHNKSETQTGNASPSKRDRKLFVVNCLTLHCTLDRSNPDYCPLSKIRKLEFCERLDQIKRLDTEVLEKIIAFHHLCLHQRIRSPKNPELPSEIPKVEINNPGKNGSNSGSRAESEKTPVQRKCKVRVIDGIGAFAECLNKSCSGCNFAFYTHGMKCCVNPNWKTLLNN